MTDRAWRIAGASVIGTSHAKTGAPCQDVGRCVAIATREGEVLIAGVSDGAGTASRSEAGAATAVGLFVDRFSEAVMSDPTLSAIDRSFVNEWLAQVAIAIEEQAIGEGKLLRDFACTFIGAVIGANSAIYLQIGDGAIVVGDGISDEYNWIFWPQHGEYANTTNFLTQAGAEAVLQFEVGPPVFEVAIFSDGIERLVLDMAAQTVHSPAFSPIFKWLATTDPDADVQNAEVISRYLGSDRINKRTDDDKTLVMATRVAPPANPTSLC